MMYKNKNIRSHYSVEFGVFIFGSVMTSLALIALVAGFISTNKTLKNVQSIDTVLQATLEIEKMRLSLNYIIS